jgi:hypothetical protein
MPKLLNALQSYRWLRRRFPFWLSFKLVAKGVRITVQEFTMASDYALNADVAHLANEVPRFKLNK